MANRRMYLTLTSGLLLLCLVDLPLRLRSGTWLSEGGWNSKEWSVREQETITKTLSLSGPPMRALVENVEGYVHVRTGSGSQVRITAHKTIRAESDSDLQAAKREVSLDFTEQPGAISVSYNAPWVSRNGSCGNQDSGCHASQRRFYSVTYDIDVELPEGARPIVSTVNGGDVRVEGTTGNFECKNVNGPVTLENVRGSGLVSTVNGPIRARFAENPLSPTSFKTVNGEIDAYFQGSLSADLRFQTFNGEIFSDFEVSPLALPSGEPEHRGNQFIYRSKRLQGARAGRGGPELSFQSLNGTIRLHRLS